MAKAFKAYLAPTVWHEVSHLVIVMAFGGESTRTISINPDGSGCCYHMGVTTPWELLYVDVAGVVGEMVGVDEDFTDAGFLGRLKLQTCAAATADYDLAIRHSQYAGDEALAVVGRRVYEYLVAHRAIIDVVVNHIMSGKGAINSARLVKVTGWMPEAV